jgi:hypothetical protein
MREQAIGTKRKLKENLRFGSTSAEDIVNASLAAESADDGRH